MPGSIKVSGSQRTVASPYIKVAGSWRQVAAGYIKVAGTWRVWHSADIVDNFNRPNSSSLGTASNGIAVWSNLRGSWGISSFAANSAGAGSDYPIATTPLTKPTQNYQIDVDIPTGAGAGIAFWATNSTNWWAAVTSQVSTTTFFCPSGGTLSGTTCVVGTTSYPASSTYNEVDLGASSLTCPNGGTLSGSTCVGTTSSYPATASSVLVSVGSPSPTVTTYYTLTNQIFYGPSCAGGAQCPDGLPCVSTAQGLQCETVVPNSFCSSNNPVSQSVTSCFETSGGTCPPGSFLNSFGQCVTTVTEYSCPNGGSLSGTTCIVDNSYAAVRACPQGGAITIDGTRCIGVFYTYSCPNGGTLSGTNCIIDNSYAASSSTTTTHTTSIIQSVNGTVSTRASQTTAAPTRSLRVTTTGNQISVISYQSLGQTGATTTLTHTPSSPAITGTLGIIKSPSTSNQTSSVDNFRAS